MRIYLAAPYAARTQVRGYAEELTRIGFTSSATWLDETHEISSGTVGAATDLTDAQAAGHAATDLRDIERSDIVVLLTAGGRPMTARRTPSAWWLLAAPATCVAILALSEPVLFVWLLVGLLIGWALVASWKWFTWHERAVAAESDLMFAPVEVVGSKGTRLQLVPPQRDGSEYEWPRIARVLGIEAGEQA